MKTIMIILICFVSLTLLSGCNNSNNANSQTDPPNELHPKPSKYESINNFEAVTMEILVDSVSSTGLTVLFENISDKQCIYGEYYLLEKKISDTWYEVPVVFEGDYAFEAIGYALGLSESNEWSVDWEWLYGNLEAGDYRIVKDILDFRGTGDFDTYYLAEEFSVE